MSARAVLRVAAMCTVAWPLAAQQPEAPDPVREWPVPWERTRPRDPYVAPDGRVWFVGQAGHYVAVLDPAGGRFRRYELAPGTGPHNLVVDRAGMVWYAGNLTGHIGRLDPADGSIRTYQMPDSAARDPHTLVFDSRGDIWFTVQGGNFVGRLRVATGEIRLVRVATPRARPYGIVVDGNDRPWIVLFGTNRIATVDPVTFELREHALPRPEARPRRLVVTPDGAVWYGDYAAGRLGRFDPGTGGVREWPMPGGERSRPYAMALDGRGRVWLVQTGIQPNSFEVFDPGTERWVRSLAIPSGGGAVRHMVYDAGRGVIWFGTDAGTIGSASTAGEATLP